MNLFVWTEALATGNPYIDEEHRELVRRVNAVLEAIALQQQDADLDQHMLQLHDYARDHFAREELEMRQIEYKHLSEHQAAHNKLLQQLHAVHDELARGQGCAPMELYRFLTWWVKDHIRDWDVQLALALSGNSLGKSG